MGQWLLFAAFILLSLPAQAGPQSCLPKSTSLQTIEIIDRTARKTFTHVLTTERSNEVIATKVQLIGRPHPEVPEGLELILRFDPEFEGVSLPYNLYSVLLIDNGEVLAWWDYSNSCEGPGLSFFPGSEIRLPKLKLIGDRIHKLQIMVWGRI